uniref:Ulp1 protease family, C-terminal catalytic domain containing protein n=1 Tax=Solanum tuberosum TaxID=4113 RepID=M1C994_SOLTU
MVSLDLPGNVDASHNEHQNSAAKSKPVQPQELFRFEDFSTNPTNQFLRRSRRASTTSSTPPSKRRKNAHPVKPYVIDVNQSEQSAVQSNKNSPISVSGVNVPDVHVPSLDPKEPTDRSGIKQVKKYLKKYIDKKFQHLEDLIKLNQKQLMNVVRNPHKQEEENISGTSTSLNMPEFNQEDHVVRSPTTNQLFDKRSSPIAMDVPDNDQFDVDVVEDQEQNLIPESKIVEEHVPVGGSKTFHQVMLDEHDADKVKDNVIKSDKSGSINSDSVSAGTQEVVDTLYGIHAPMDAQPLQVVTL